MVVRLYEFIKWAILQGGKAQWRISGQVDIIGPLLIYTDSETASLKLQVHQKCPPCECPNLS